MNTEINNANPVTEGDDEAARRAVREAEDTTASNAEAAADADADTDAEAEDEAEDANRQVRATAISDVDSMMKVATIVQQVQQATADHLAAIREDQEVLNEAAAFKADADDARTDTWGHVIAIVGAVADATADAPTLRDLVYTYTMGEFMKDKERSTAKSYASTGRQVLVKLLTEQKMDFQKVSGMKYSEVRDALRPPKSAEQQEAENVAATAKERLTFILRNAGKNGGDVLGRVQRIAEAIEREYNPVKAAKDAGTKQAQAAREISDLRQQSPREGSATETVAPPAPRRHIVRGEHRQAAH